MAANSTRKRAEKPKQKSTREPVSEAEANLLAEALERLDKLAESQLEMSRLFIDKGKTEIARRRLNEIIELYPKSSSASEARKLLKKL